MKNEDASNLFVPRSVANTLQNLGMITTGAILLMKVGDTALLGLMNDRCGKTYVTIYFAETSGNTPKTMFPL